MPRRTSTCVTSSTTPQAATVAFQPPTSTPDPNILLLRRHWKWAAFSQFFFTFNALFAMNDVTLIDIENDLAYATNCVLSRIMTRLLVTLTQDRKISADNWQTALRKQYARRDPNANPIGPIQQMDTNVAESSRASTAPPLPSDTVEVVQGDGKVSVTHKDGTSEDSPLTNSDAVPEHVTNSVGGTSGELNADQRQDEVISPEELLQASKQPPQMDWHDLPTVAKLDSLYTLMEWQFQNPSRLRTQMKDDDEDAQWRIEPIGYDARRNAYWLIGADRLWIQRQPPRPTLKRKRPISSNMSKYATPSFSNKRQQFISGTEAISPVGTPARSSRLRNQTQTHHPSPSTSRSTRAAKLRANQKLDAQAKDLAEYHRQVAWNKSANAEISTPRRPSGIRVSARLRGTLTDEEEWQEVPEEWLAETHGRREGGDETVSMIKTKLKTGLESDEESISDLTELSEDENANEGGAQEDTNTDGDGVACVKEVEMVSVPVLDEASKKIGVNDDDEDLPSPLDGFTEWETICITLEEWEIFPEQFEHATHYAEKSLYKVLMQSIVPTISAELREVEKKKRKEEAVVHRKRSSRIALKESEKEQELLIARRRAEEDERMARARRAEARRQKEEADRIRRENAREQRRKEREAKQAEANTSTDNVVSQEHLSSATLVQREKLPTLPAPVPTNGTGASSSGSRTPAEDWELDCEICGSHGINQDDGVPIMCCGKCSKWQHIMCHDRYNAAAGRPKRNWDAEDFICKRCQLTGSRGSSSNSNQLPTPTDLKAVHGTVGSQFYRSNQPNQSHNHYPNGSYYVGTVPSGRHSYEHHSDIRSSGTTSQASQPYSHAPRTPGVTFAHYQPQQGGFSTSRPSYSIQESSLASQRHPQPTPLPLTGVSQYRDSLEPQAQGRWQPSRYPRNDTLYSVNTVPPPSPYMLQPQHHYSSTPAGDSPLFSQMHTSNQSMPQYSGYQQGR